MKKTFAMFGMIFVGCILCGLYGSVHNQLSYTVSPGFFENDLFYRFNTQASHRNRLGASIVGYQSTWWMGLFIAPPIALVGLLLPDHRLYRKKCLIAFGIAMVTALSIGLFGLAVGGIVIPSLQHANRAGVMHDFSYAGGGFGLLTAIAYIIGEIILARSSTAEKTYQA
jgi:hypothetical protein